MPEGEGGSTPKGCVHFSYGDGRGKTTSAVGLALRLLAAGRRVHVLSFLKDGRSGEMRLFAGLEGCTVASPQAQLRFSWAQTAEEREACRRAQDEALAAVHAELLAGSYDALILDEAETAVRLGLLDRGALFALIDARPPAVELVITGHGADAELIARADYVTELVCHRHPFTRGLTAREGIEY